MLDRNSEIGMFFSESCLLPFLGRGRGPGLLGVVTGEWSRWESSYSPAGGAAEHLRRGSQRLKVLASPTHPLTLEGRLVTARRWTDRRRNIKTL